jgi:hypothetical protein
MRMGGTDKSVDDIDKTVDEDECTDKSVDDTNKTVDEDGCTDKTVDERWVY